MTTEATEAAPVFTGKRLPSISNLWTSSRDDCAARCLREHYFAYGIGYRLITESDALRFGTLIHHALEAWWKNEDGLTAALAAISQHAAEAELDPYVLAAAKVLIVAYDGRWLAEMDHYEVLAVEARFEAPMVNPETGYPSKTWRLGGKIDAIVRDLRTMRVLIVEHKTTSEDVGVGSNYWRQLRINGQIGMYYSGAKALGHEADGVLYDVVSKPTLRPYKATPLEKRQYKKDGTLYAAQRDRDETPEEYGVRVAADVAANLDSYFARAEVVRLNNELTEYQYDIWQRSRTVADLNALGRAPKSPKACVRYGSTCAYFEVCTNERTIDDPTRYRKVENHPELADTAPAA